MHTNPVTQPHSEQKVPLATEFENWIKILERGKPAASQAKEELQRIITCNTQHDTSEVTKCVIMMQIMNSLLDHPSLTMHNQ